MAGTTGSRTPSAPDRGVCAISPSDLVGYVGNLINRVKDLEQEVDELKAKIVQANQLSDISQQIGWVGGVKYLGMEGWTRTAAGTLIPPPGFYLGNIIPGYHGGLYDANGDLQFGFGDDGTITGELADLWNSAGPANYAFARYFGSWETGNRNITINTNSISGNEIQIIFQVSQAGLYWFSGHATDLENTPAVGQWRDTLIIYVNGVNKDAVVYESQTLNGRSWSGSLSGLLVLAANDQVEMINNPLPGMDQVTGGSLSLFRISS